MLDTKIQIGTVRRVEHFETAAKSRDGFKEYVHINPRTKLVLAKFNFERLIIIGRSCWTAELLCMTIQNAVVCSTSSGLPLTDHVRTRFSYYCPCQGSLSTGQLLLVGRIRLRAAL